MDKARIGRKSYRCGEDKPIINPILSAIFAELEEIMAFKTVAKDPSGQSRKRPVETSFPDYQKPITGREKWLQLDYPMILSEYFNYGQSE